MKYPWIKTFRAKTIHSGVKKTIQMCKIAVHKAVEWDGICVQLKYIFPI